MTRQEAEQILIHYDDLVWQRDNYITCGMISEALNIATEALNPWHKVSEVLPKEGEICLVAFKPKEGGYMILVSSFQDGYFCNIHAIEGCYEYWMEIPELPKED